MVQKNAETSKIHIRLTLDHLKRNRLNDALTESTRAVNSEPKDILPRILKVSVLRKLGYKEAALSEINEATSLEDSNSSGFLEIKNFTILGTISNLVKEDDFNEKVSPKFVAYIIKGLLLKELGRNAESSEVFKTAEQFKRKKPDVTAERQIDNSIFDEMLKHIRTDTLPN